MKFGDILQSLLEEEGLKQSDLAEGIGVSQRAVSKWVTKVSEPTETSIYKCAKFFEVSADYLIGLEDACGFKID